MDARAKYFQHTSLIRKGHFRAEPLHNLGGV
ncbi:hypothetical protein EYZ11_001943 [Aspergillus tanneri]|uniref:Uncharacterized protein n=1 Tax=Aspergillus tanneri TaxID=1220188 RepID=A0A4S3JU81_9EURO|nr:hypothetical protein EYZ11_001943 [Aspergillus tanneri]